MTNEPKVDLDNENQEGENLDNQKEEVDTQEKEMKISKKEYQSLLAQKEHWREKAKAKTEEKPEVNTEVKPEVKPTVESNDPMDTIKMFNALKDYSPDEIETLSKQAKVYGVSLTEVAEIEDVQLLLKAKREKIKNEQANPIPGTRQEPSSTDFSKWTAEDRQKLTSNPTKENIAKLGEYTSWLKSQR